MAKRGAVKELTHENWEDEDEPEDMGTFRQATSDQLAGRQIKKARRRGMTSDNSSGIGIFKGLTSFSSFGANKDAPSQPSFSFLSKDSAPKPTFDILSTSKSNTTTSFTTKSEVSSPEKKPALPTFKFTKDPPTSAPEPKTNGIGPPKTNSDSAGRKGNKVFLSHLKALNEGVVKWVKQHLDTNPHVNLSPVFDDYKKHFEELTKKYPSSGESESDDIAVEMEEPSKDEVNEKENQPVAAKMPFSFTSTVSSSSEKSVFGGSSASTDKKTGLGSPVKPMFSFGAFEKKAPEKSLFGGSTGTSSIFGSFTSSSTTTTTTTTGSTTKENAEADPNEPSDEPPKVEVNEVKEDDAIYEKKCKLFYMKDGGYVEKGVGTLFLKPAGEKTQLLIRALTNLGNILLNIILNPTIPTARAGKNGVIIACIPNPPLSSSSAASNDPVKMLIRVKTAEDADALNEKITELKK
ncbi:nuclear pore complex protein Nup50-like [Scylla paramamosain]|uniref:nuclear pore complex protein Nup50-like n=1 Tax=Scylla paramamosain TaxID=85552 RepID=UPI003083709B